VIWNSDGSRAWRSCHERHAAGFDGDDEDEDEDEDEEEGRLSDIMTTPTRPCVRLGETLDSPHRRTASVVIPQMKHIRCDLLTTLSVLGTCTLVEMLEELALAEEWYDSVALLNMDTKASSLVDEF